MKGYKMTFNEKIKSRISINDSYSISTQSLILTLLSGLIAYHILIIYGFTNPDGICEGLTYYTSGDWALAGCGRWAIRYMNEMTCNIVIPLYVVLMYGICIWLVIVLLSKLWKFADSAIIVLSILLIVTPAIAEQLTYTYTALAYAYSCLLAVLFVYLMFRCDWRPAILGGSLSIAIMMGLYQSYIGMVAVLVVMTLIYEIISLKNSKLIIQKVILSTVSALVGYFIYSKILETDLAMRGLDNSGTRVADFSFSKIFEAFPERVNYIYFKYFVFLRDKYMHRNILYWLILIVFGITLAFCIYRLLQNKKYGRILIASALIAVIPLASNIIGILIPYNGIEIYMQYQTILIVPFMFTCLHLVEKDKVYKSVHGISIIVVAALAWTFVLAANATYKCYELSYRHINSQMQIAIARVYDLEDYVMDETPILIAGYPTDMTLRNSMDIYQYAENLYENPAFWPTMHGVTQNRYLYFLNYFGIDAQQFSDEEYATIINSSEFAEMPIWPDRDSVAMIDGFAVVKFTEQPPMP